MEPSLSATQISPRHPLWDWPTRLFHWSLPILLPLAWWTAEEGQMERHQWIGYTVLVLVVFRIGWGVIGSRHSRFADFVRGPRTAYRYTRGRIPAGAGHNPLGGWSVLVLLLLLLTQAVSGLFNSDRILFDGPFYHAVDGATRDFLGVVHEWAFNGLMAMVVLHLLAVAWHQWRLGEKLLQAMVWGRAEGREGEAPAVGVWRAVVLIAALAGLFWWLLQQAPPPPRMW